MRWSIRRRPFFKPLKSSSPFFWGSRLLHNCSMRASREFCDSGMCIFNFPCRVLSYQLHAHASRIRRAATGVAKRLSSMSGCLHSIADCNSDYRQMRAKSRGGKESWRRGSQRASWSLAHLRLFVMFGSTSSLTGLTGHPALLMALTKFRVTVLAIRVIVKLQASVFGMRGCTESI